MTGKSLRLQLLSVLFVLLATPFAVNCKAQTYKLPATSPRIPDDTADDPGYPTSEGSSTFPSNPFEPSPPPFIKPVGPVQQFKLTLPYRVEVQDEEDLYWRWISPDQNDIYNIPKDRHWRVIPTQLTEASLDQYVAEVEKAYVENLKLDLPEIPNNTALLTSWKGVKNIEITFNQANSDIILTNIPHVEMLTIRCDSYSNVNEIRIENMPRLSCLMIFICSTVHAMRTDGICMPVIAPVRYNKLTLHDLPGLESMTLKGYPIQNSPTPFAELDKLKSLSVTGALNAGDLSQFVVMKDLELFHLEPHGYTDHGGEDVASHSVEVSDLSLLPKFQKLRSLDLAVVATPENLQNLANSPSGLKTLSICLAPTTEMENTTEKSQPLEPVFVGNIPHVQELEVYNWGVHALRIGKMAQLSKLHLGSGDWHTTKIKKLEIADLPALRSLSISGFDSIATLTLQQLPRLYELELDGAEQIKNASIRRQLRKSGIDPKFTRVIKIGEKE